MPRFCEVDELDCKTFVLNFNIKKRQIGHILTLFSDIFCLETIVIIDLKLN